MLLYHSDNKLFAAILQFSDVVIVQSLCTSFLPDELEVYRFVFSWI